VVVVLEGLEGSIFLFGVPLQDDGVSYLSVSEGKGMKGLFCGKIDRFKIVNFEKFQSTFSNGV